MMKKDTGEPKDGIKKREVSITDGVNEEVLSRYGNIWHNSKAFFTQAGNCSGATWK